MSRHSKRKASWQAVIGPSVVLIVMGALVLMSPACQQDNKPAFVRPTDILRSVASPAFVAMVSEIKSYGGDDLFEYIDGAAEQYLSYGCLEVATADFRWVNDTSASMVVDIYLFASDVEAYGLYSMLRSPGGLAEIIDVGIEGQLSGVNLDFVKGRYVVRLTSFVDSPEGREGMKQLAIALSRLLPGAAKPPFQFAFFPSDNAIEHTDRYYARAFMGWSFLSEIFSRDFLMGGDTLTLFFTTKQAKQKFEHLAAMGDEGSKIGISLAGLAFDGHQVTVISLPGDRIMVAGVKGSRLVGIVNYSARHDLFLTSWLSQVR